MKALRHIWRKNFQVTIQLKTLNLISLFLYVWIYSLLIRIIILVFIWKHNYQQTKNITIICFIYLHTRMKTYVRAVHNLLCVFVICCYFYWSNQNVIKNKIARFDWLKAKPKDKRKSTTFLSVPPKNRCAYKVMKIKNFWIFSELGRGRIKLSWGWFHLKTDSPIFYCVENFILFPHSGIWNTDVTAKQQWK